MTENQTNKLKRVTTKTTVGVLGLILAYFSIINEAVSEHPSDLTGSGSHTYANGDRYEGRWKNGKRHGYGVLNYKNGDRYAGVFSADKRHGPGKLTSANGDSYSGQWRHGRRTGTGSKAYANGNHYKGDWKNGRWDGHGILFYKNGDRYEGGFKADKKHGKGVFVYANGNRYEGYWENGKKVDSVPKVADRCKIKSWKWTDSFDEFVKLEGSTTCSDGVLHLSVYWAWKGERIPAGTVTTFVNENYFTALVALTSDKPFEVREDGVRTTSPISITYKYRKSLFD